MHFKIFIYTWMFNLYHIDVNFFHFGKTLIHCNKKLEVHMYMYVITMRAKQRWLGSELQLQPITCWADLQWFVVEVYYNSGWGIAPLSREIFLPRGKDNPWTPSQNLVLVCTLLGHLGVWILSPDGHLSCKNTTESQENSFSMWKKILSVILILYVLQMNILLSSSAFLLWAHTWP